MNQHRGMIIRLRQQGDSQCTAAADCIEELESEKLKNSRYWNGVQNKWIDECNKLRAKITCLRHQIDEMEAVTE